MSKIDKFLNEVEELRETGNFGDALSVLNRANKISPDNPCIHLSYAVTYDMMDQFQHSTKHFSKALLLKPDDPETLTQYGITLCRANKYKEAIDTFKKSLSIDPDYSYAKWHLGILYRSIGFYEDAINLMEECLKNDLEQFIDEIHYQLGLGYYDMGWTKEAIREFRIHLEIVPDDLWGNLSLGNCFLDVGWIDESIRKFQEIINSNPNFIPSYNALALSFAEKGWYKEALEVLKDAQKISPEDQTIKDSIDYIDSLIDDSNNNKMLLVWALLKIYADKLKRHSY